MLRFNLAILLAEKNLKITKVSHDTGISRTTLTSIYYNYAKGIQINTLNELCMYLKTTPDNLISYIPVDIELPSTNTYDTDNFIDIKITTRNNKYDCVLDYSIQITKEYDYHEEDEYISEVTAFIGLPDYDDDNEKIFSKKTVLQETFHSLPLPFLTDLENRIAEEISNSLNLSEECAVSIIWNDGLDIQI